MLTDPDEIRVLLGRCPADAGRERPRSRAERRT
jgi:hypothetical protein